MNHKSCKGGIAPLEVDEDVPDDIKTSDRYIMIPHKNDFDLGRRLAPAFVDQELAGDYDTIARFFRKKGAYGRFKDFLHGRNLLDRWYEFEARATERTLRDWCAESDIMLAEEPPST